MKVRIGLAIAVALLTAALIAMIGVKQWTLSTGTAVVLETRPVDPRSLFRGDYVRLGYVINRLDADLPGMSKVIKAHETMYVTLRQDGTFWKAVSVHAVRPDPAPGDVVIKGETPYGANNVKAVEIRYGIEEYFVPEGEGLAIQRPPQAGKVSILVAVDRFGNAGIKAVLIDGVTRYEEKLF
jgi:uncharacterized membrane-anchored protein